MYQLWQSQQFEQSSQLALSGCLTLKDKAMIGLESDKSVIVIGHPKKKRLSWTYVTLLEFTCILYVYTQWFLFKFFSIFIFFIWWSWKSKQNWPFQKNSAPWCTFLISIQISHELVPHKKMPCCQLLRKQQFLWTTLQCGFVLNTNKFLPVL